MVAEIIHFAGRRGPLCEDGTRRRAALAYAAVPSRAWCQARDNMLPPYHPSREEARTTVEPILCSLPGQVK